MLPLLIISGDKKKIKSHIDQIIKKQAFTPIDIISISAESSAITIEQIREIDSLFVRSYPKDRLIIIYNFETAKIESQNALLKTLEENGDTAQFVLVSSSRGNVLPTIISRCEIVIIAENKVVPVTPNFKLDLSELLLQHTVVKKTDGKRHVPFDELIDFFRQSWRASNLTQSESIFFLKMVKETIKARQTVLNNNVNVQTALDHLLIYYKKKSKNLTTNRQ